ITEKRDRDSAFRGFLSERRIHAALNDTEKGLGGGRVFGFWFLVSSRHVRNWKLETRDLVPRYFLLMLLKILLAPLRPSQREFHRLARAVPIRWMLGTFVKRHHDIGTEPDLRVHCAFRTEEMGRSVQVGAEGHACFCHLTQLVQTENLETARSGEHRAGPGHEAVQPSQLADLFHSRPQIEMVGIPQNNLYAEFLKNVLGNAFDRGQRAHRHEHRGLHDSMRRSQPSGASGTGASFDLKGNGHCWGL